MIKTKNKLDINPEFKRALDLMENTDKNVFITGRAGTGKSTLLSYFRERTKKKVVVLAPTGVAAINVGGQTIHSFFGFKSDITLQKVKKLDKNKQFGQIYKKLDVIIIDEISMVRADLLDCVDKFMKLNGRDKNLPFGGAQMIFFGDLYQLPPVVTSQEKQIFRSHYQTPYFFSAHVFSLQQKIISDESEFKMEMVELEKIYRQEDDHFISLLNAVRNNTVDDRGMEEFNKNYQPDFEPPASEMWITLTTTNDLAASINDKYLSRVKGKERVFKGQLIGGFDIKNLPTELKLKVKIGAQIMLLNNDRDKRWVNGTIGQVVDIFVDKETGESVVETKLADGEIVHITLHQWDMFNFVYDHESKQINSKAVGSFIQYPFKLAWAVTIHKSQGKTFDKVVLDIGRGTFSPGQLYVALSRCTAIEGLVLKRPIAKKHVWLDWQVVKFVTNFQYQKSDEEISLSEKIKMIEQAIELE